MSDRFQPATYPVPASDALVEFMRTGWADEDDQVERLPIAPWAAQRRAKLAERFQGERIVVPAGPLKPRANDTDYRFRAATDHVYLTGNQSSDAVLVLDDGEATLYFRPRHAKSDDAFWRDGRYGEAWAGRRRSLTEATEIFGLTCRHLYELPDALRSGGPARVLRGVDPDVDALVPVRGDGTADRELATHLAEMRLVKDAWEIEQLQDAIDSTILGFEDSVREWDNVVKYGERWIEGTFWRRARAKATTSATSASRAGGPHATHLALDRERRPDRPRTARAARHGRGEPLVLHRRRHPHAADRGPSPTSSATSTTLVFAAQEAGIAAVRRVRRTRSSTWPRWACSPRARGDGDPSRSVDEALDTDSGVYRRWTLHGTGHMLGLDVHDCSAARRENYNDGKLEPGMVLTVEPGLYFQSSDLLVPESLRGIGIRIEDDVVVTEDGCRNLSGALARTSADVEAWMATLMP